MIVGMRCFHVYQMVPTDIIKEKQILFYLIDIKSLSSVDYAVSLMNKEISIHLLYQHFSNFICQLLTENVMNVNCGRLSAKILLSEKAAKY